MERSRTSEKRRKLRLLRARQSLKNNLLSKQRSPRKPLPKRLSPRKMTMTMIQRIRTPRKRMMTRSESILVIS
jgi:hypothetical protein